MKRTIEMLGILCIFAVFCPSSAEAVISGNGYAYENGESNGYAHENGESYAYKWNGEPEGVSPKYSYEYTYKNGEANGYAYANGESYAYKNGEVNGNDASNVDSLDEMTQMEFNYAFKNQGLDQGPFQLMKMESYCQPDEMPVENRKTLSRGLQPVPEPGTMLLLAFGGSLLVSRRRR